MVCPIAKIADKVIPNRKRAHQRSALQHFKGEGYDFLKIEMNNYIGNPK